MFRGEAARLCEILIDRPVSPLLNLGSGTAEYREIRQPFIERDLFTPLRKAGVKVFHCDLKSAEGIDLAGNVLDPKVQQQLRAMDFKCVLVSNLLEHVTDRDEVMRACAAIVGRGGLILATVPSSYPYHPDPIDTLYRPCPEDLAAAFPGTTPVIVEELMGQTYSAEMRADGIWREVAITLARVLISALQPRRALAKLDRWRWYRRPYRVALVLVRVR